MWRAIDTPTAIFSEHGIGDGWLAGKCMTRPYRTGVVLQVSRNKKLKILTDAGQVGWVWTIWVKRHADR